MKVYKKKLEKIDPHGNLAPIPQFKKLVDDANTEGDDVKKVNNQVYYHNLAFY